MSFWKENQLPALLTILLAITSWLILSLIDKADKAPLVKYTVTGNNGRYQSTIKYRIENINYDKGFTNVDFFIRLKDNDTILAADNPLEEPMKINPSEDIFKQDKKFVNFHLTVFQPKCAFTILIQKSGKTTPPLRYSSNSFFILTPPSTQTFVKENEYFILITLIGICILLILLYLYYLKR